MYKPRNRELTLEEKIRQLLEGWRPRFNSPANDSVVVSAVKAENAESREDILRIIDRLGDERNIIYAPAVSAALRVAKARHPRYNFDSYGAEKRVLDKAEEWKFDLTSVVDLSDTMEWIIGIEHVPLSAFGKQSQQQQAAAEQRQRLLASIKGDKSTYPAWSGRHGKIIDIDAASLDSKTNEELAQIEHEVSNLRRQMGMSREQQKETLHQFANRNRVGYDDRGNKIVGFENRPQVDSLGGAAAKPYSDNPTASPIAARVDIRSYQANAKVDYNGPHGANQAANDPFISPATGVELTKKEAYQLAKNDLPLFRKLTKKDPNRLNRILGVN